MKRFLAILISIITINVSCVNAAQPQVGDQYIDIALTDNNNNKVAISELLANGKWVLIDFWATWCGPCRGEIPHLVEAYKEYAPKGLEIYSISLCGRGKEDVWRKFIDSNNMTWINVWGYDGDKANAAIAYGVEYIPTNFLVSPDGKIVATQLLGNDIKKILSEHIK